jgi:hypothetical protein
MNTIELFSTMLQGGKEVFLSVEDLLTMFNRNISKNAELLDYIGRKNLFEMIGKTRNEGVHSRFIAELLSGVFFMGQSRESTLIHFLDLLLYRSAKENKASEINAHFKKRILTRSLSVENADSVCELPVKEYQKMYNVNNTINTDKNDRIDIYIRYELTTPIAGRDTLEIFIENKVNSSEFDSQTLRYFEACDNGGYKRPFQLFIFLTPQPLRDMENYYGLDNKYKPTCPHYIHICYQDILSYIIEPLMNDERLEDDKKAMLKEYVSCLELPAMPDAESQVPGNELSIMAISSRERSLVETFMEDAINRRVINKAVEAKLEEPLFSVTSMGELFNATEAMKEAVKWLAGNIKPLALLKKVNDCAIVGPQNGAKPYLVYSPDAWRSPDNKFCKYLPFDNLYVYSGKIYVSLKPAVTAAIEDYKKKHHKSNEELVKDFSVVFSGKGGGIPLVSEKKQNGNAVTDIKDIYIRKNIPIERLQVINDILGEQLAVKPIDNESYNSLLSCSVQLYDDKPVTENGLPREIEGLLQDFSGYWTYEQVGVTPFFFRKDIARDRILNINKLKVFEDRNLIEKSKDTSLLLDFFNSRRNLILSVYKVMLEAESDKKVYKEKLSVYRKLLMP